MYAKIWHVREKLDLHVLFINAQNAPYTILDEKSIMISRCEPNWSAGNDIKIERENNCFIEVIINPLLARVMSK